jgi:long-chain acyl-CoA synthetase
MLPYSVSHSDIMDETADPPAEPGLQAHEASCKGSVCGENQAGKIFKESQNTHRFQEGEVRLMSPSTKDHQHGVLQELHERVEKFGTRDALRIKEGSEWRALTYKELSEKVRKLSSYLLEQGLKKGERIGILCESRPEWAVAFFGAVRAGATIVPLDIKLTETELTSILSDCNPSVLFSDTKHLELAKKLPAKVTSIKNIYVVDEGKGDKDNPSIDQLNPKTIEPGINRELEEVALIVYTSGTTGSPKGVMTSYGNLMFQTSRFQKMVELSEEDRFLSILPLNHLLELTGGFLGLLNLGATVTFCHSLFPQEIMRSLKEQKITGMVAVPLFYKSLKGGIEREIRKKGEEAVKMFEGGLAKAKSVSIEDRRKMFAPILEELGGSLRVLISGGAPLETEVAEFFESLGIQMLQGYGLTETSPVISGNTVHKNRLGSVGPALDGVEVKIDKKNPEDSEGEILTRGPHIMMGYHHRDDLTKEIIDEQGWLHTGDLGHLDEDGFLFITGRIKNMIVLGGGKKIFPEEVEAAFGNAKTVKELCVLGKKSKEGGLKGGTEEVCVVAVPADSLLHDHKDDPQAVQSAIKKELEELGQHLAVYKRPTRTFISNDDLPKTATRKVKRQLVLEWLDKQGD